jgi:stigma-specific protein Stig1
MRSRSVGLVVGLFGVVLGPTAAGCTSILGDFPSGTGDASVKESGGGMDVAKTETGGGHDSGHPKQDSGKLDSGADMDVSTHDAPEDVSCSGTVCSGTCVDTTTDGKNCGRCAHSCLTGGTCSAGKCGTITMVSATSGYASQIDDADTDGTVVVWGDGGDGSVDQVSTPGGTKLVLVAAGDATNVRGVAIGTAGVVGYTTGGPGTFNTATVGKASSGVLENSFGSGAYPDGLAWTPSGANAYMIVLSDLAAGPYLLAECSDGTGCGGSSVTAGANPYTSFSVGVNATGVVWGDVNASTVNFYDTSSAATTVIAGQKIVSEVAADSANIYWTTSVGSTNGIFSAKNGMTTVNTVLADALGQPSLAADGTNVYYVNGTGLYYVPVGGASSGTAIDTGAFNGVRYANGALVYWTDDSIFLIATP